jgi:hypothetical protein
MDALAAKNHPDDESYTMGMLFHFLEQDRTMLFGRLKLPNFSLQGIYISGGSCD